MTGAMACEPKYQSKTIDEADTGSCREYEVLSETPLSEKVDICVTVVGGAEPPTLPIREELRSNGVECVYDAKGIGQEVVSKEREQREAEIIKRLKVLEKKLQKANSPRKRKKGLKKLLELQKSLEKKLKNTSSGITYSSYALHMVEMMKKRCLVNNENNRAISDESSVGSEAFSLDVSLLSAKNLIESTDRYSSAEMRSVEGRIEDDGENTEDTNTTSRSLAIHESSTETCIIQCSKDREKDSLPKHEIQQVRNETIPTMQNYDCEKEQEQGQEQEQEYPSKREPQQEIGEIISEEQSKIHANEKDCEKSSPFKDEIQQRESDKETPPKRETQQEVDETTLEAQKNVVRRRSASPLPKNNNIVVAPPITPIRTKKNITEDIIANLRLSASPHCKDNGITTSSPSSSIRTKKTMSDDSLFISRNKSSMRTKNSITNDPISRNKNNHKYGDTDSVMSNEYLFDDRSEVGGVLESVCEDSVLESVCEDSVLESLAGDSVYSTKSAKSVSFKGIRASTEETLSRARALLASAKSIKKNIEPDSDKKTLKTDISDVKKNIDPDSIESIKKTAAVNSKTDINDATAIASYPPPASSTSNKSDEDKFSSSPLTFTQESGRYHLFVTHACPWSHRTSIVRALKGIEDVIGMSYVNCTWDPLSVWDAEFESEVESDASFWSISESSDTEDLIFQTFKEVILENLDGPIQVPVLWDKEKKCIISNSSIEIMWILNFEFNKWAKRPKLNLFPSRSKASIDKVNKWVHNDINVGVYRCGVATSQENYDKAIDKLTIALDKAEAVVKKRGFLAGKYLTESDIRLFVTLIRFDEVYRVHFKTNTRRISKMSGLLTYARDIYQVKKVKETCNMDAIKKSYFCARTEVGIVPRGEGFLELLDKTD